jgi:sugar lactone lactonase YvrE
MADQPECVLEIANVCGEGPLWDVAEQALYWVDIPRCVVHRFEPSTGRSERWTVPAAIGCLALRRGGGAVAALRTGFALLDLTTNKVQTFANPEAGLPETRFNDGKCDARGRLWCGSMHDTSDPQDRRPIAALYRVDPDLACHRMLDGIRTSNGLDWSPDGRTMYYTDTPTLQIDAFDFDPEAGTIANRRAFATVPQGVGRPDGLAVDEAGYLWSAHFDGWRVTRYAPDGRVDRVVRLPVQNVTSCAFGGPDLDILYITSATEDLSESELERQPLAGGLFAHRPGVRGRPMHRFAG